MGKKLRKTRNEKLDKKHDFKHLVKTKTAAKQIEAEAELVDSKTSPLSKQVNKDLKVVLVTMIVFVSVIVVAWLLFGKTGKIFDLAKNINLF